ncbi:50S ribosomal protein L4 [Candidatus Micrarchaeota archaeon]|nr:50S ribosomal protein L4 [Candidatus Micrarchaeota archaeon]
MNAIVFDLNGGVVGSVELPKQFDEEYRKDLIRRAVVAEQTRTKQPKSCYRWAGLQTSARYRGRKEDYGSIKNHGISRLPRTVLPKGGFGKVRRIPFAVGGRRTHPPKVDKVLIEKINAKEWAKAVRSAISATVRLDLVKARGHEIDETKQFPLIVENSLEGLKKTEEVLKALNALGLGADLKKSEARRHASGVAANRRGGSRQRKSVLIIVGEDNGILKSAKNICGVDVALAEKITAELLAPGTHAGRLTVWSKNALGKLKV